jgi:hypothetical protein
MPQLVPRNTFDPDLSACESQTRIKINERLSSFVVVENEFVLSSHSPSFQKAPGFRIDRNRPGLVRKRYAVTRDPSQELT